MHLYVKWRGCLSLHIMENLKVKPHKDHLWVIHMRPKNLRLGHPLKNNYDSDKLQGSPPR